MQFLQSCTYRNEELGGSWNGEVAMEGVRRRKTLPQRGKKAVRMNGPSLRRNAPVGYGSLRIDQRHRAIEI
jgi:hypothetical protein